MHQINVLFDLWVSKLEVWRDYKTSKVWVWALFWWFKDKQCGHITSHQTVSFFFGSICFLFGQNTRTKKEWLSHFGHGNCHKINHPPQDKLYVSVITTEMTLYFADKKNEMSQSNRLRTLFSVLNWRVDVYLNFQKWPFLCSFALANVLALATGSIVLANMWQWTSMQLFNRSYFIVFLRYVSRRLRGEKLRSDVEMEVVQAYSKFKCRKPNWFIGNPIN